jgi:iron(III) transport system ATP-binding protein
VTARISVEGLRKTVHPERGRDVRAVNDVSLEVGEGELLVILGPSGSGKTTLLRCIAGLEEADAGEITVAGKTVYSSRRGVWVPPERRGISMVFQTYALWPHMTVFKNVAYPLQSRRAPKGEIGGRVRRALELVGCGQFENRYPSQLSGGQQQRVALARAVVDGSSVVLFDEPLSSVDALVRDELRREIAALQRELGFSSIYITHDQVEATVLGHRVAVLSDGVIAQIAPPRELYAHPSSKYVAQFLGAANIYSGVVEEVIQDGVRVNSELGPITVSVGASAYPVGTAVSVITRPEHIRVTRQRPSVDRNVWPCKVERESFLVTHTEYVVRVNTKPAVVRSMETELLPVGSEAWMTIDARSVSLLAV